MCADSIGDSQTLCFLDSRVIILFYFEESSAFICSCLFIIMNSMWKLSRHLQLTLFKIKVCPDLSPAPRCKLRQFLRAVAYDFCYCIHSRHSPFKSTFIALSLLHSTQSPSAFLHLTWNITITCTFSAVVTALIKNKIISLFEPVTLQSVFT